MSLFDNLFKRKRVPETTDVSRAKINRAEVHRVKVHRVEVQVEEEPKICSAMIMKFRDTVTGEVRMVEYGDDEAFDEYMGNKNMQLIFG